MKPVEIVIIKEKKPLYKGEELANRIELILLEEVGFELVVQKDLYQKGDKAVYIQPDYSLSDIPLFESFIRPGGKESKSMLGKVGGLPRRIRAKKFNMSLVPNGEPVYSNGILLPIIEVQNYLDSCNKYDKLLPDWSNVSELLEITKYEEPEEKSKGTISYSFPTNIYKTDEDNILKVFNNITFPIRLVGTEKVDGSSITIGVNDLYPQGFICSRNVRKKLTIRKIVGKRKKTLLERIMFWREVDLNIYKEYLNSDDDFVKYGSYYLNKIKSFGNIILRGELHGGSLKGSGNKNNPARKLNPNIKFFGIDVFENGEASKLPDFDFREFAESLDLPLVYKIFDRVFSSKEELIMFCNSYFKESMIEGIVVRTHDSKFSAKIMNLEYDSKK